MGLLDVFKRPTAPQQATPNQPINYNPKPRLGGLIDAIGYGLSPQAFAAGRTNYQNRVIGGINDEAEQLRAAQQFGRTDIMERLAEQQKLRREAEQRRIELNRARIAAGQFGANPAFSGQMQRPQAMQPQMMPQMQNQAPMQPQVPEGATRLPDGRIMDANGAEIMPVNEQRMRPQAPMPRFNEYEHNLNIARQLFQEGDSEGAQSYFELAQKAKQADDMRQAQMFSAGIAPANLVQDNPATPNINERFEAFDPVFNQLKMLGYEINPQLQEQLIQNPQLAQFMINQASLGDAAKQSIETQGEWNKPPEFTATDFGGNFRPFDKRSGQFGTPIEKSVDPNVKLNNDTRIRTEAMGNSTARYIAQLSANTSRNIAAIRADVTKSEGEKDRAIQREEMQLKRDIAAATGGILPSGTDTQYYKGRVTMEGAN